MTILKSLFGTNDGPTRLTPRNDIVINNDSIVAAAGTIGLLGTNATYEQLWRQQLWVRVCVNKLSWGLGRLPLKTYQRDGEDRRRVVDAELSNLLRRPNQTKETGTAFGFKRRLMRDILVYGNALVIKIQRRPDEPPTELRPVNPIGWSVDENGDYVFQQWQTGNEERVKSWRMIHLMEDASVDGGFGISRLEALHRTLAIEDAAQRLGIASFSNGNRLSGLIKLNDQLRDEAVAKRFRENVRMLFGGVDNAYKVPVLEGGAEWQSMSNSMEEAAVVPFRQLSREEVAAAYDIPQPAIGILNNANFASTKELHQMLYTDTFGPWVQLIQQGLDQQLIDGVPAFANQFLEFELGEVLRGDIEARSAAYQRFISSGVYTPDECRQLENKEPMEEKQPEAGLLHFPMNLSPNPAVSEGNDQ